MLAKWVLIFGIPLFFVLLYLFRDPRRGRRGTSPSDGAHALGGTVDDATDPSRKSSGALAFLFGDGGGSGGDGGPAGGGGDGGGA